MTGPHTLRCESCGMLASTRNRHHPDSTNLLAAIVVALFEAAHDGHDVTSEGEASGAE